MLTFQYSRTRVRQGRQAEASAVKLSSNENPFDPLPSVVSAVQAELEFDRYPDATADRLRQKLANRNGLPLEAVHMAAGSVAIISRLMQAVAGLGDEAILPTRPSKGTRSWRRRAVHLRSSLTSMRKEDSISNGWRRRSQTRPGLWRSAVRTTQPAPR